MRTNAISASRGVHARTIATTRHLIFRRACLWTGFLAFATVAFEPQPAQAAVTEAWQRYGSEAGSGDFAYKVVTDAAGNVIVMGFTGTGLIIKYSGAGMPLWTNRYDNVTHPFDPAGLGGVAVDGSGNVFVTGSVGFGFDSDYATIAYSGAGVPLWTNRYNGPGNGDDFANAVAVDGSGNVFVTGSSGDYATIAYSRTGVPLWTNRYNGPGNGWDYATAVAVDASGNVIVTGYSGGDGNDDYATIAYSSAGVPLWTNRYDGPANLGDLATAVAVNGSGNVFVTGTSATIAYSGAGVPLWTNRYNGPSLITTWPSLAIGSDGAVYVTSASNGDFATVKYVWQTEIAIQLLSTIPPKVNLTLSGAPNSSWAIERALELTGPWTNLSALLIGTNGSAQFQDTNSPYPAGFYRARQ